ncbi:SAM domain and HD domain-containing protein 1 [Elysia marginata]|uniref:SAM domain and HD domain-containing protein 1 n=1 Tax=Elysia marginata TaxID=1093978 RepID=A0AAV4EQB1_9GAST|nr:SAM domain and HD domain-containing protein 1 [Elysia marginata]
MSFASKVRYGVEVASHERLVVVVVLYHLQVINDCVHGHIQLSRDVMRIVDTRQVQRLRDLKQLGLGSYVFPGATHTRFAHSIGVCYLAGTFLRQLKKCQPNLRITDRDIFCVEVAGLCHDLGHGPFSHMFEKAVKDGYKNDWAHEDASLQLFDMMVEENSFEGTLFSAEEINFIKELIHSEEDARKGPEGGIEGKEFLYEIVSNERTGLDVDKFDYFARDCHVLGISNMFDLKRFMMMARVLECEYVVKDKDGNPVNIRKFHICHRDKELENLIIMFQTRFFLHMNAYKHPVVCALDRMVCDAFLHADKYLKTPGDDKLCSLTESIDDMKAYIRLNDSVLHRIRDFKLSEGASAEEKNDIEAAQKLIERIEKRQLYKLVHTFKKFTNQEYAKMTSKTIEVEILATGGGKFDKKDIYVQIAEFGFGMKEKNPLTDLYLYSKKDSERAFPFKDDLVSELLLPKIFSEKNVRVYCKTLDQTMYKAMEEAAKEWEKKIDNIPGLADGGININNLRYADNTVMLAENEDDLQKLVNTVKEESEKCGLFINIRKTKTMVISREKVIPRIDIKIDGERVEQVANFTYLGHWITEDGRSDQKVKKRIGMAKNTFLRMSKLLTNRRICFAIRSRLTKSYVWSVFLYACETWTLNASLERNIEALEMWLYRRMARISWKEKKNKEVLEEIGLKHTELLKTVKTRQLAYYGHICPCQSKCSTSTPYLRASFATIKKKAFCFITPLVIMHEFCTLHQLNPSDL